MKLYEISTNDTFIASTLHDALDNNKSSVKQVMLFRNIICQVRRLIVFSTDNGNKER